MQGRDYAQTCQDRLPGRLRPVAGASRPAAATATAGVCTRVTQVEITTCVAGPPIFPTRDLCVATLAIAVEMPLIHGRLEDLVGHFVSTEANNTQANCWLLGVPLGRPRIRRAQCESAGGLCRLLRVDWHFEPAAAQKLDREPNILEVHRLRIAHLSERRLDLAVDAEVHALHVDQVLDARRIEGQGEARVSILDAVKPRLERTRLLHGARALLPVLPVEGMAASHAATEGTSTPAERAGGRGAVEGIAAGRAEAEGATADPATAKCVDGRDAAEGNAVGRAAAEGATADPATAVRANEREAKWHGGQDRYRCARHGGHGA